MKKIVGFFVVLFLVGLGILWMYLKNFATKADVWSWENNYSMHLPLWMESLPQSTGALSEFIDKKRTAALQELGMAKEDKQAEFNAWLTGLQQKADEAAKAKADAWIDAQFGSGTSTGASSGSK